MEPDPPAPISHEQLDIFSKVVPRHYAISLKLDLKTPEDGVQNQIEGEVWIEYALPILHPLLGSSNYIRSIQVKQTTKQIILNLLNLHLQEVELSYADCVK